MTYSFTPTPFAETSRQAQFEAVRAALLAEADAPATLLLGNLGVDESGVALDAVVLRPHSLTILQFVPQSGRLSIPNLSYGAWVLNSQPLRGAADFDNPFEQFTRQKAALQAWLRPRLSEEQANLRFITGVVVFGGPLSFGPEVEAQLNGAASASGFQLLAEAALLPRRLRQLAGPEIDLSETDLQELLRELAAEAKASHFGAAPGFLIGDENDASDHTEEDVPPAGQYFGLPDTLETADEPGTTSWDGEAEPSNFLSQKARQLWGWLGAADIPDEDPPYGHDPAAAARGAEEKARLEELRQQMQTELSTQLQAMRAREAEREDSIAQLRTELSQAPAIAPEAAALQARLTAENQEKAALEAAIAASRAEAAARNQALDAKIDQLTRLIGQLSAPASAVPEPASAVQQSAGNLANGAPAPPPSTTKPPADSSATQADLAARTRPAELPAESALPSAINPQQISVSAEASAPVAVSAATAGHGPPQATLPQTTPVPPATTVPAGSAPTSSGPMDTLLGGVRGLAARWRAQPRPALGLLRDGWRRVPRPVGMAVVGVLVLLVGFWGVSRLRPAAPAPARQNGRWGYANADGELVVPARYSAAEPFRQGRAVVVAEGAHGFINEKGEEVVKPAYDALNAYAGGYARARVGETYMFLDEQGQELSAYYFNALDFAEGYAAVLDQRGWHYITGPDEPAVPPLIFREAYSFQNGRARVRLAAGYTFITPEFLADSSAGTKPFGRYELAGDFTEGRARVRQAGRTFFIDEDGDEVKE